MRFPMTLTAGALLLLPLAASAEDTAEATADAAPVAEAASDAVPDAESPAGEAAGADAAAPVEEPKVFKQDKPCMPKITDALLASFGEVTAWPDDWIEMYTPEELSAFGHPISYILAKHGGPGGKIDELDYRLEGMQRKIGHPHDPELLKAFDKEFKNADCAGSTQSSCGFIFKPDQPFTGAEIGSGEIDMGRGARGPKLNMVKGDYDLLDNDPVFLVCFYRGK